MTFESGWFHEKNSQWPGIAQSYELDVSDGPAILVQERSAFQELCVFKSRACGKVLLIDGVVQLSEREEASYHEMMAHLPLAAHASPPASSSSDASSGAEPNKLSVLIIGGGDGGVLREVCRYACVESVVICEIDQRVIDISREHFPTISYAWSDSRVELMAQDAVAYVKRTAGIRARLQSLESPSDSAAAAAIRAEASTRAEELALEGFDVIIADTSDPDGPAEALFEAPFYQDLRKLCRPGARVAAQGESMFLDLELMGSLIAKCGASFDRAEYASIYTPMYPNGQIGVFLCSVAENDHDEAPTAKVPRRLLPEAELAKLQYYTPELHSASFVLPAKVARVVAEAVKERKRAVAKLDEAEAC